MLETTLAALALCFTFAGCSMMALKGGTPVVAFPILEPPFLCSDHWAGELAGLGDALGKDCIVSRLEDEDGRTWQRMYRGRGLENEDWFGWQALVLAPCDGVVTAVHTNEKENLPGIAGHDRASSVTIRRSDGVHFILGHLRNIRVREGAQIAAGAVLGSLGNSGFSRSPHVHIGAWRGNTPLPVSFDLNALGQLAEKREQAEERSVSDVM